MDFFQQLMLQHDGMSILYHDLLLFDVPFRQAVLQPHTGGDMVKANVLEPPDRRRHEVIKGFLLLAALV